jgi:hypothetical protein
LLLVLVLENVVHGPWAGPKDKETFHEPEPERGVHAASTSNHAGTLHVEAA